MKHNHMTGNLQQQGLWTIWERWIWIWIAVSIVSKEGKLLF